MSKLCSPVFHIYHQLSPHLGQVFADYSPNGEQGRLTHSYPIALGKQKSGAHHPKAPNVVLIAAASPPDGIDKKFINRIKGDENVQRILKISFRQILLFLPLSTSSSTSQWNMETG
jgi:hypothetical protein